VLLYEPEVNLAIGVRHLRAFLSQYGPPGGAQSGAGAEEATAERDRSGLARALAAYNAGQSRVARWSARAGAKDPEVFIDRIPFAETRDYVRIVLRTAELYRALYAW
jgi:soluble lytic murein transglycosylase